MRTKTNNWTKKENARRYLLHQRLKGAFTYSAKGRTIQANPEQVQHSKNHNPAAYYAIFELGSLFGYNVQAYIEEIKVGDVVRIHAQFEREKERGRFYTVDSISGNTAMMTPTSGRWRRPSSKPLRHLCAATLEQNGKVRKNSKKGIDVTLCNTNS